METRERKYASRWAPPPLTIEEAKIDDWDKLVLKGFDDFPLRTTNWLQAFYMPELNSFGFSRYLTKLVAAQLLGRQTINTTTRRDLKPGIMPPSAFRQVQTYWRTPLGDRYLKKECGYQTLPRSDKHDAEQVLLDVVKQSTALHAAENGLEVLFKKDIVNRPGMPQYITEFGPGGQRRRIAFNITDGDKLTKIFPDDFPLMIGRNGEYITVYDEMDLDTEDYKKIRAKLVNYKEIWERKLYLTQHGFQSAVLRFTTTRESRVPMLMEITHEVFGGKCNWIIFAYLEDHTKRNGSPEVTDRFLTEPYPRVGAKPFSLLTLSEV